MTPAQKERAEQIKNAEAAYKRGEITVDFLAWYRRFTAKAITTHRPRVGTARKATLWTS